MKIRKYHSLAARLFLAFMVLLALFFLGVNITYNAIMKGESVRIFTRNMQRDAYSIAQNLYDLVSQDEFAPSSDRLPISQDTLQPFLQLTQQLTRCKVYVIERTRDVRFYADGILQTAKNHIFPPYIEETIAKGFMGKSSTTQRMQDEKTLLCVCSPLMDENSVALGVVMLTASLAELGYKQMDPSTYQLTSLIVSLPIALLLSLLMSIVFTRPITRVQKFAMELAEGEYCERLSYKRRDEIGALAQTMDALSAQLENARKRDQKLQHEQQVFFSNISHELRTPVTVIRASAEALKEGVIGPENRERYFGQMLTECTRLERLIRDLLELSRLQSTQFSVECKSVSLTQVLSECAMNASMLCEDRGVVFCCEEPKTHFRLEGDETRIRQMLMVVIDNAIKFTAPGKTVSLMMEKDRPVIHIADEGVGMTEEEMKNIFERFRATRSMVGQGTGLGLSIAKEIARRHHVTIDVSSTPGLGTEFVFTFHDAKESNH